MNIILLVSRLLLAAVFVTAALTKLTDRAGFRQALIDFGLPHRFVPPLSFLLPLSEGGLALALVSVRGAWWGGLGALSLLLVFNLGIAINLARGHAPDCHCFGQLHSEPIGWPTLIRNGLFMAIAGVIVWSGPGYVGLNAGGWLASLPTLQLIGLLGGGVGLGLLALEGWFVWHLLRQQGRLLIRIEMLEAHLEAAGPTASPLLAPSPVKGLPLGMEAPAFRLPTTEGKTVTLEMLLSRGKPAMLIFIDPNCGPCSALLPDVARWQREHAARLTIAPISRGDVVTNRAKAEAQGLKPFLLQQAHEVAQTYQVQHTPSAVVVLPEGVIGSSLVAGAEAIQLLLNNTIKPPVRIPAPSQASSSWALVARLNRGNIQLTNS